MINTANRLFLLLSIASAFVPPAPRLLCFQPYRQALIFGDYEDEHGATCLEETLSNERVGALARLAAAFSPNTLNLKDIQHVKVLNVDSVHLDLEAVVCEDDGCVTLIIPVSFPSPCGEHEEMEECVLDNVSVLDHHAATAIEEREVQEEHTKAKEFWKPELISHDEKIPFPGWWVPSNELANECDNIQSLLNSDEFAPEVQDLACQYLEPSPQHGYRHVVQAAVVSVCPAGMFLRAVVDLGTSETIRDVPIQFPSEATTAEGLRMLVLGAVANASENAE